MQGKKKKTARDWSEGRAGRDGGPDSLLVAYSA